MTGRADPLDHLLNGMDLDEALTILAYATQPDPHGLRTGFRTGWLGEALREKYGGYPELEQLAQTIGKMNRNVIPGQLAFDRVEDGIYPTWETLPCNQCAGAILTGALMQGDSSIGDDDTFICEQCFRGNERMNVGMAIAGIIEQVGDAEIAKRAVLGQVRGLLGEDVADNVVEVVADLCQAVHTTATARRLPTNAPR